ncbi:MAG: hypothetical protein P1P64_08420 [Treponemataceae bacterium]
MSKIAFDFLTESFLFHEADQKYQYRTMSELINELTKYKEYITDNKEKIDEEISKDTVNIIQPLTQVLQLPSIETLTKGSLFLDTYLINDPLFDFNLEDADIQNIARQYMNMPQMKENEFKEKLAEHANYMKSLTEGVRCDTTYIKFYPLFNELYPRRIPIFNIPDLSTSHIDENVMNWFYDKVELFNLDKENKISEKLNISNKIFIRFKDDKFSYGVTAAYQEWEMIGENMVRIINNYIPTDSQYKNWTEQEIIKAIKEKYHFFVYRNTICEKFKSPVMLNNNFEREFAEKNFHDPNDSSLYKLGFNLDFVGLQKLTFEKAMHVRRTLKEGLKAFQEEIYNDSIHLSTTKDKNEYTEIIKSLENKYMNNAKKAKTLLDSIKYIVLDNIIPLTVSALSYFVTPEPYNKIITGLNIIDTLKTTKAEIATTRKNPFYFLKNMIL